MTYRRTLPRDLFNESSLMGMTGRLWIAINEDHPGNLARFVEDDVDRFDIVQDESSGSISIANVTFEVAGQRYLLERPLNARGKWPMWLRHPDDEDFEEIRVFDDEGNLSPEMMELIGAG